MPAEHIAVVQKQTRGHTFRSSVFRSFFRKLCIQMGCSVYTCGKYISEHFLDLENSIFDVPGEFEQFVRGYLVQFRRKVGIFDCSMFLINKGNYDSFSVFLNVKRNIESCKTLFYINFKEFSCRKYVKKCVFLLHI